jgi:hypothetical protein
MKRPHTRKRHGRVLLLLLLLLSTLSAEMSRPGWAVFNGDTASLRGTQTLPGVNTTDAADASATSKIILQTFQRSVYGNGHQSELLRLDFMDDDAKAAITFRQRYASNLGAGATEAGGGSRAWLQAHEYLSQLDPDGNAVAHNIKTFTKANVRLYTDGTAPNTIDITAHGYTTGSPVIFYAYNNVGKNGYIGGLEYLVKYYVRAVSADRVSLHPTATDATNNTNIIPFTSTPTAENPTFYLDNWNIHLHSSWEVSSSDGVIDTRISVPYGMDWTPVKLTQGDFILGGGDVWITGVNANRNLFLGRNYQAPYWVIRADSTTANPGSSAGADLRINRYDGNNQPTSFLTGNRSTGQMSIGTSPQAPTSIAADVHIRDATLGTEVFRLETIATNDDPRESVFQGRLATTDATQATLLTINTTSDTANLVVAYVTARRTGGTSGSAGDSAGYSMTALVKNVGGTATVVGSPSIVALEDQAGWDATVDASAGALRVRVTGAANNNVTWHATVRVFPLSS